MKRNRTRRKILLGIVLLIITLLIIYILILRPIPKENIVEVRINLDQFLDDVTFKEKENIDKSLEIESFLRTYISPMGTFGDYRTIEYNIIYGDGRVITKKYNKVYPINKIFKELLESTEYKKQAYKIYSDEIYSSTNVTLRLANVPDKQVEIFDIEKITEIIKLLQTEYISNDITEYINNQHINTIEISFKEGRNEISNLYYLNSASQSVLEILKKIGVYEELFIISDDIESITINNGEIKISTNDKEIIQIILDEANTSSSGTTIVTCDISTKKGTSINGSFSKENLPKKIEDLFYDNLN